MKYLGIDFGTKRIGLAVSDAMGAIAFPRATVKNDAQLFEALADVIRDERVKAIVVGDTRSHGGMENPITKDVEAFIENLKKRMHLPVERGWEAGSSIEASRYAEKGDEHHDSAAAAIILQRFLEMRGHDVQ